MPKIVTLFFGMLFFSAVFIIIGIFKEYKKIQKSVFNFGIIVEIIYMVYLYIFNLNTNIYRYIIYLALLIFAIIANNLKNENVKIIAFIIFTIIGISEIAMVLI